MLQGSAKNTPPGSFKPDDLSIPPAERKRKEKKRRRIEILLAILAFFLVLVLTSIQLDQFETGDRLFVAMFNVNFILLLAIALVVFRNIVKLLLERRQKVLGSRLRTRLVLAFVGLTMLPCLLMFLVTTKYVQLSMDFWFKEQVETSMEMALDVARLSFDKTGQDLVRESYLLFEQMKAKKLGPTSKATADLLRNKGAEFDLALAGFLDDNGITILWQKDEAVPMAWGTARKEINWNSVRSHGSSFALAPGYNSDYIFSVTAVPDKSNTYLVFAENMGPEYKNKIDRVIKGAGEYKNLRNIKKPLKHLLYSSLGVLTTLIILGALWFAFRIAREISAPVMAVAAGTERIAKGDLSVRLQDTSEDELGVLIRSFNQMAMDLESSRAEVIGINSTLEKQNIKIERHNKYIETVLDNIAAGVISFDARGHVITMNKAASDILALSPTNLVGKKVEDVLSEPYAGKASILIKRLRNRQEGRITQTIALPIDGEERRLLVNVVGFSTDGHYSGAVAVFEDISEVERMERLAAWREVARRIAHEIKNPLTPIKLSAQRLARKFGCQINDPVFTQSTDLIVKQVEHLQYMVQEFSAFAKLPEVKPQAGKLEPILENVHSLFKNSHSNITWQLDIEKNLPVLLMDKDALSRALLNLYTNAAEALKEQEGVKIVLTSALFDKALNLVRIDVIDNGPGLTEDERSHIFEPYFSKKKGGTGLGLPIVRSIIADHRGYVRALPNPEGGTIISIELPLQA